MERKTSTSGLHSPNRPNHTNGAPHNQRSANAAPPFKPLANLQRRHPDKPCVVVLHLGSPSHVGTGMLGLFMTQAETEGCDFSAAEIHSFDQATQAWLRQNVPAGSLVTLLGDGAAAQLDTRELADTLRYCQVDPPLGRPVVVADSDQAYDALIRQAHRLSGGEGTPSASQALNALTGVLSAFQPFVERANDFFRDQHLRHLPPTLASSDTQLFAHGTAGHIMAVQNVGAGAATDPSLSATSTSPLTCFSDWLTLPEDVLQNTDIWSTIASSPYARHLVALVADLRSRLPDPQGPIGRLLHRLACAMARDITFAEQVLYLADAATATCSDRKSLVAFRLESALMAHELGQQAQTDAASVAALARRVYRRSVIEAIGARKVQQIEKENLRREKLKMPPLMFDPVETHLAYLCGLQDILDLGGEPIDAMFISEPLANVSGDDISRAYDEVRDRAEDGFVDFLSSYAPWQAALRADPLWRQAVREMDEELADYDTAKQLQTEVQEQVARTQLTGQAFDQAVTREVGRRSQAARDQAWTVLTLRALTQLGL